MNLLLIIIVLAQPNHETNPVTIVFSTSLSLYQDMISSSQGNVCNFSPSCSHFAKTAISKYGPLWGSLMAADRLMRCNPWSYQHVGTYYPGVRDRKIVDPIDNNYIFSNTKNRRGQE